MCIRDRNIAPLCNSIIRNGTVDDKDMLFRAFIGEDETVQYKSRGQYKEQSLQEAVIRIGNNPVSYTHLHLEFQEVVAKSLNSFVLIVVMCGI